MWRNEVSPAEYLELANALAAVRTEVVELRELQASKIAEALPFALHAGGAPADFIRACQTFVQKRVELKQAEEAVYVALLATKTVRPH